MPQIGVFFSRVKVKEVNLYSTFIEVPYTQGAQVRITQCYLTSVTRRHDTEITGEN